MAQSNFYTTMRHDPRSQETSQPSRDGRGGTRTTAPRHVCTLRRRSSLEMRGAPAVEHGRKAPEKRRVTAATCVETIAVY
jgi:hypothetical protein